MHRIVEKTSIHTRVFHKRLPISIRFLSSEITSKQKSILRNPYIYIIQFEFQIVRKCFWRNRCLAKLGIGWPVIKSKVCAGRSATRRRCTVAKRHVPNGCEIASIANSSVDCEFERRTLVTNDPPPSPDRINAVKARVPRLYYPIPWLRGNPPRILVFLGWIMDWGKKSAMIPIFRRIESVNRE